MLLAQTTQPVSDGSWIGDWIASLYTSLVGLIQWATDWCIMHIFDLGSWVLDLVAGAVPKAFWPVVGEAQSYLNIANEWVPLDYAFKLLGAYIVFVSAFVAVKFVLKLIPTIG